MKKKLLLFFFFIAGLIPAVNGVNTSNLYLSIDLKNGTIKQLFEAIERQSGLHFSVETNVINLYEKVTVSVKDQPLASVLDLVLKDKHVKYQIKDQHVIITESHSKAATKQTESSSQPTKKVTGVIKDETGELIIGASIQLKGESVGTISDLDGRFSIQADARSVLVISYLGYAPKEVLVGNQTTFNIIITPDLKMLDEVVVTALGIKRSEKALGYAVQKVGGSELSKVKGVDVATSLTGKIAGVNVRNSTEFGASPDILIRGKKPLIVIDGIPYGNMNLSHVAADDIAEMTILKGPTASALYGERAGSGAIMITTKRGSKEGLAIDVNSNTMFNAGHLRLPNPQTSYSLGTGGKYGNPDYVWGDKLDIGRVALQYDPYTYEMREMPLVSKGKDNFKNFMQSALVTNNNLSVAYKAANGSFRTSLNHVYNKGQYPNLTMNKFNFSVAGDLTVGKLKLDASMSLTNDYAPQTRGDGYSATGYVYNFLVWTGTEFDIRDYRQYWVKNREEITQNYWPSGWYDNPYFLAYGRTASSMKNTGNGQFNATYEIAPWLSLMARAGYDFYSRRYETKTPMSTRGSEKGAYSLENQRGHSVTGDFMATAKHTMGDFDIDGLFGSALYFYEDNGHKSSTNNGLIVPGFYSLNASVDPRSASASVGKRQSNSLYGKIGGSWKNAVYLEATGRNDWVSTLDAKERSYFYPSVSSSIILTELLPLKEWTDFWKIRGSWVQVKEAVGVYKINTAYSITTNQWDNKNAAGYPTMIRSSTIKPIATEGWEVGTTLHFWNNRLRFDYAYYQELKYNLQREAGISDASGFEKTLINIGEEQQRKGMEVTISADIINNTNFNWTSTFNWARDRYYYHKVDKDYSTDRPWVAAGKRWDWMGSVYDWERDSQGNIVHRNGLPVKMDYDRDGFNEDPDWIWGFNNEFKYKAFTLAFSFDGRVGGYGYNQTEQAMWNSGTHPDSDNQWRWDQVVDGKVNYVGKGVKVVSGAVKYDGYGRITEDTRVFALNDVEVTYENYIRNYEIWSGNYSIQNIKKMTFVKLRELTLGYDVPKRYSSQLKLSDLKVSLVGQNLWMWSKNFKHSDPDINKDKLNSPSIRYVGFNVKFSL